MRKLVTIFFLLAGLAARAQYVPNSSQAFQFASVYNPAFTGTEVFTDIKLGYRYQSTGFGVNSPKFVNMSVNFRLKQPLDMVTNALRTSNAQQLQDPRSVPNGKRIIHGLGANVFNEKVGLIDRLGVGVTYSFHYPISRKLYLATGLTALLENTKLDMGGIYLGQEPDPDTFYDHLMQGGTKQTDLNIRGGILLYGKNFYLGVSYLSITEQSLKSSDLAFSEPFYRATAQAGFSFPVSAELVIKPSAMAILQVNGDMLIDYSVKGYIRNKAWLGLTYRDVKASVLTLGFDFNSMVSAGYSYEMSMGEFKQFNDGSHEIVVALRLNNFKSQRQYIW